MTSQKLAGFTAVMIHTSNLYLLVSFAHTLMFIKNKLTEKKISSPSSFFVNYTYSSQSLACNLKF